MRNAFEQTLAGQGPITVHVKEHARLVTDTLATDDAGRNTLADASSCHGYGLGLGIVQWLCERNGWSFSLQVDGARVTACLAWGE